MRNFGLIGKNLEHSFSKKYFQEKFLKQDINDSTYINFETNNISNLSKIVKKNRLKGLNVTIPYKQQVLPFLNQISKEAEQLGAVNTIKIQKNKFIGYNTDIFGFEKSLTPIIQGRRKAIILGNGGVSRAVQVILLKNNIEYLIASRSSKLTFLDITPEMIQKNDIIINTTPLGMYPKIDKFPNIPYNAITAKHLLYDVIYNPKESSFLKHGRIQGAQIKNGEEMLYLQAEESWKIWNK